MYWTAAAVLGFMLRFYVAIVNAIAILKLHQRILHLLLLKVSMIHFTTYQGNIAPHPWHELSQLRLLGLCDVGLQLSRLRLLVAVQPAEHRPAEHRLADCL
jgi:hypothetical protein